MLDYLLVSKLNGIFRYAYFPEGKENEPGYIEFSKDRKILKVEDSTADFKRVYAGMAIGFIDLHKTSGTIAWC